MPFATMEILLPMSSEPTLSLSQQLLIYPTVSPGGRQRDPLPLKT